jgi:hypothetical protein
LDALAVDLDQAQVGHGVEEGMQFFGCLIHLVGQFLNRIRLAGRKINPPVIVGL